MIDDLNDLSSYFERVFDEIDGIKKIKPQTLNFEGFGLNIDGYTMDMENYVQGGKIEEKE
jgi:hypothetical protein